MMALERMGSRDGSISSSTSCISTGVPSCTACSIDRRKSAIFRSSTFRPRLFSMLLIHLLAWPCGSIMSGQREPRLTSTPFSTLKSSPGRPCSCHSRTSVGSDRKSVGTKPRVTGILRRRTSFIHSFSTSSIRYSELNGPAYDRNAEARRESPVRFRIAASYFLMDSVQRSFSPPNPPTISSARVSLACVASASSCSFFFSVSFSFVCFSSASTFSVISCSTARASASIFSFRASSSVALSSFIFFGITSFCTMPNRCMAITHRHRPLAALDTFPTSSGLNLGLAVYLPILVRRASFSSSLLKSIRPGKNWLSPIVFLASSHVGGFFSTVWTADNTVWTASGGVL
mmetsp:Transcript_145724/g.254363  ORF Transcript_145724/g.254363 Transcript_145724/m.254363 type:complete len:345 (-) Transcript_145724:2831-3865(-)